MATKPTILVADDEVTVPMLLTEVLSDKYDVLSAHDGKQAWEAIQERVTDIDLVITDIQMPHVDGITLLTLIKKHHAHIGVIMISGTVTISTAVKAMRQGALDYITKPFQSFEELEIIIERYFERQQLEHKLAEYVQLHQEMMTHMKVRTFLCLDVVGSTKIKEGEDPFLVQFSFMEYHRFVEEIVKTHHGLIHGTAGDGIMCCFDTAQGAVDAGIELYRDLPRFNGGQNKLVSDFVLRSGAHTGSVIIDNDGHVSEMFSSTLDITGHLQKYAETDRLEISEDTLHAIANKDDFVDMDKEVDGVAVFTYKVISDEGLGQDG
jgi:CheY-like chemotaxis protein